MATTNIAVYGLFKTREQVEDAVNALKAAGFRNSDISILFPDTTGSKEFAHDKGTKLPEGAATGGASGGVIGGALGWLAGIGALAIPGAGPFIAAGPIMAALAGAGVGGSIGWLAGALIGIGIPEYEAKMYESTHQGRTYPALRAFRQPRMEEAGQGPARIGRRGGHRVQGRGQGGISTLKRPPEE